MTGNAAGSFGEAWQRFRMRWRELMMLRYKVTLMRHNLSDARELQAERDDAIAARLCELEAVAPSGTASWLAEWDAVVRSSLYGKSRLAALRLLFVKLANAAASPPKAAAGALTIDLAPGEVLDRMTILEIKLAHIKDPAKLKNVQHEHDLLLKVEQSGLPKSNRLAALRAELKATNQAIWDIEDRIRDLERAKDFGPVFVEVARSVYRTNDKRAAVKRQINDLLGSTLVEEKSYAAY
jgi:hypothetical protein